MKAQNLTCLRCAPLALKLFSTPSARTITTNDTILDLKPYDFVRLMKKNNTKRCFVVYDKSSKSIKTSDGLFDDLKVFCEHDQIDFKEHEGFFLEIGKRSGALMGTFIWRTNRGQAVRCLLNILFIFFLHF